MSLNSTVSCGTTPIAARSEACVTLRISCPSIVTRPPVDVVEAEQDARLIVDLPAPDGPTIATILPAGTSNDTSFRIGRSGS